jgi:DNA-binding CsgD family transcriptional regulator/PAS domain-containing protein
MDEFMQLVELGYDAVADFSRWPQFLASYNQAIGAERCGLYVRVHDTQSLQMFESTPADSYWAAQLAQYYSRISPLTEMVKPRPAGWAGVLEFPKSYWRSEFYNDYMAPQNLRHAVAGIMAKWSDTYRVTLMGFRGKGRRPFAARAGSLQSRVMHQLRWAFRLRHRLLESLGAGPYLLGAWDVCPQAAIMLDERRRIAYSNPAAEQVLATPGALLHRRGQLAALNAEDDRSLQRLIRAAMRLGQGSGQAGGTLAIRSRDGTPALHVQVYPLNVAREVVSLGGPRIAVVVFLVPQYVPEPLSVVALRSRFALTPAESRLALALVSGEGLRQVAEMLGVTYGTARAQLLAIFAKTGTHRQAALLRMLLGRAVPVAGAPHDLQAVHARSAPSSLGTGVC